jgi:hypothetical protein
MSAVCSVRATEKSRFGIRLSSFCMHDTYVEYCIKLCVFSHRHGVSHLTNRVYVYCWTVVIFKTNGVLDGNIVYLRVGRLFQLLRTNLKMYSPPGHLKKESMPSQVFRKKIFFPVSQQPIAAPGPPLCEVSSSCGKNCVLYYH